MEAELTEHRVFGVVGGDSTAEEWEQEVCGRRPDSGFPQRTAAFDVVPAHLEASVRNVHLILKETSVACTCTPNWRPERFEPWLSVEYFDDDEHTRPYAALFVYKFRSYVLLHSPINAHSDLFTDRDLPPLIAHHEWSRDAVDVEQVDIRTEREFRALARNALQWSRETRCVDCGQQLSAAEIEAALSEKQKVPLVVDDNPRFRCSEDFDRAWESLGTESWSEVRRSGHVSLTRAQQLASLGVLPSDVSYLMTLAVGDAGDFVPFETVFGALKSTQIARRLRFERGEARALISPERVAQDFEKWWRQTRHKNSRTPS